MQEWQYSYLDKETSGMSGTVRTFFFFFRFLAKVGAMNALKERRVRRNRSFVGMVYGGVDLFGVGYVETLSSVGNPASKP